MKLIGKLEIFGLLFYYVVSIQIIDLYNFREIGLKMIINLVKFNDYMSLSLCFLNCVIFLYFFIKYWIFESYFVIL